MVNPDIVSRKLAKAEHWLSDAEVRLSEPRELFLSRAETRDLATFYLFLAMQETIDLAAHWVADAGWDSPEDAGGTFDVLASRDAIPQLLADQLRAMAGLRNRIAHGYATVQHDRLYEEAREGIPAIRKFLVAVAQAAGV